MSIFSREIVGTVNSVLLDTVKITAVNRLLKNDTYPIASTYYDDMSGTTYITLTVSSRFPVDYSHIIHSGTTYYPVSSDDMGAVLSFTGDLSALSGTITYYYYENEVACTEHFPNIDTTVLSFEYTKDFPLFTTTNSGSYCSFYYDTLSNKFFCNLYSTKTSSTSLISVGNTLSNTVAGNIVEDGVTARYVLNASEADLVGLTSLSGYVFSAIDRPLVTLDGGNTVIALASSAVPAMATAISYKDKNGFVTFGGTKVGSNFVVTGDVVAKFSPANPLVYLSNSSVVTPSSLSILSIERTGGRPAVILDGKDAEGNYFYLDIDRNAIYFGLRNTLPDYHSLYQFSASPAGLYAAKVTNSNANISIYSLAENSSTPTEIFNLDLTTLTPYIAGTEYLKGFQVSPNFGSSSTGQAFIMVTLVDSIDVIISSVDGGSTWQYVYCDLLNAVTPPRNIFGYVIGIGAIIGSYAANSYFKFNGTSWVNFTATGLPPETSAPSFIGTASSAYAHGNGMNVYTSTDGLANWSLLSFPDELFLDGWWGSAASQMAYADKAYFNLVGSVDEAVYSPTYRFNDVLPYRDDMNHLYPLFGDTVGKLYLLSSDGRSILMADTLTIPTEVTGVVSIPNTGGIITLPHDINVTSTGDLTLGIDEVTDVKGGKDIKVTAGGKLKLEAGRQIVVEAGTKYIFRSSP
jgi:hypothetical protein